jgi:hypothetical protein
MLRDAAFSAHCTAVSFNTNQIPNHSSRVTASEDDTIIVLSCTHTFGNPNTQAGTLKTTDKPMKLYT